MIIICIVMSKKYQNTILPSLSSEFDWSLFGKVYFGIRHWRRTDRYQRHPDPLDSFEAPAPYRRPGTEGFVGARRLRCSWQSWSPRRTNYRNRWTVSTRGLEKVTPATLYYPGKECYHKSNDENQKKKFFLLLQYIE